MTWRECLAGGMKMLEDAGIPDADIDARILLESFCGISRSGYYLHADEEMPQDLTAAYQRILEKRRQRIPLQHLTGEQEFMGLPFAVTGDVLIPRQDTETLAEEAIACLKKMADSAGGLRVLDLCTGSGCLAVSIKHVLPDAAVTASDISAEALAAARENAGRNRAEIDFVESDLFDRIPGAFHLIVSNPPYIPTDVIETLMPEVRRFEPRLALDGGADGLMFYREIAAQSAAHLVPGGWIYVEIGCDQGPDVAGMFRSAGLGQIQIKKDLAGNPRIVCGCRMGG